MRPRHDAGQDRSALFLRLARLHQDDGGGAVIEARCVAGGHRTFLVESGTQLAKRLHRGAVLRIFVGVNDDVPLARLHRDGNDLVLELAGLLRGFRLVLRTNREFILLLARDLPLLGDVLRGVAHVIAVEGVPEAVLDHGVDHFQIAHLGPFAQMRAMRRLAHGFLAARDHDFGIAVEDGLIAERDRAQARTAQLVNAPGWALDRNASGDRGLPRRILSLTRGQDLTHDHLGHLRRVHAGALERLLDRDLAQFMRRQARKGPVESTDRRPRGADDDDIVCHG